MINPNTLKYLHCETCSRGSGEAVRGLSVAVTPEGHLYVRCVVHGEVVAYIENNDVAGTLREAGEATCRCGNQHKETTH